MSAQPNSQSQNHRRFGSRSGSRALLQEDVDIINRYSRKYSNTYKTAPYAGGAYGSIRPSQSQRNISDSVSVASQTPAASTSTVVHAKRPSNLISSNNRGLWNDTALSTQSNDMESAMQNMIQSYQSRLEKQAHFMDEIEREAVQNKDFGKLENADNWSNLEVCHWLSTIHLEKYIQHFADQIIDGSILIRDLDETILITELNVKKIHVKKILREIVKLRRLAKLSDDTNNSNDDALVKSLKLEITSLQRENQHLRDRIKSIQNQTQTNVNFQELASSATGSHFSSNSNSISSLPSNSNGIASSAYNSQNNYNYSSKYGSSSQQHRKGTGNYGTKNQSHNYTVNPRKKY